MGGWMDVFVKQLKTIAPLEARIRKDMLEKHNISEGCWGIPEGSQYTFTRSEFYNKALDLGVCTQEELNTIYRVLHSIWYRDLSD